MDRPCAGPCPAINGESWIEPCLRCNVCRDRSGGASPATPAVRRGFLVRPGTMTSSVSVSHRWLRRRTDFTIDDMTEPGTFTPDEHHLAVMRRMLDELTAWGGALRALRARD